jgi:Undecaprenyl-phosphate glucose phosphotransferase
MSMTDSTTIGAVRRRRFRYDWPCSPAVMSGLLCAADFAVIACSGIGVYFLFALLGLPMTGAPSTYIVASLITALVAVSTLGYFQLYFFHTLTHPREKRNRITAVCALAFIMMTLVAISIPELRFLSVKWGYAFFGLTLIGVNGQRRLSSACICALARRGLISRNIVIIGGGEYGARFIRSFHKTQQPWTRIVGVFDDRASRIPKKVEGYPVLGTIGDLLKFTRDMRIDDIFVALPWSAEERVIGVVNLLRAIPANVHLTPEIIGAFSNRWFGTIDGVPVLNVSSKPIEGWNYILKGIEDRVVAALAVLLLAPLLLAIVVAIKLDSPGPALFRQKRYGWNNKIIDVYKFRTMHNNLRDDLATQLTTRNDPRVTRIGRFLRRTSLDELPQFFNVLKGEMSVVGPRPHALQAKAAGKLYHEAATDYAMRHKIKPGVTGWAQINGWRGETDTEEKLRRRVEHDLYYMENWSIMFDLYIILRTARVVFTSDVY